MTAASRAAASSVSPRSAFSGRSVIFVIGRLFLFFLLLLISVIGGIEIGVVFAAEDFHFLSVHVEGFGPRLLLLLLLLML